MTTGLDALGLLLFALGAALLVLGSLRLAAAVAVAGVVVLAGVRVAEWLARRTP